MQIDPLSHHSALEIQCLEPHVLVNGTEPRGEEGEHIRRFTVIRRWPFNGSWLLLQWEKKQFFVFDLDI